MWGIVLLINSVLLTITSTYLVYSIGAAILLGTWKELLLVFILEVVLILTEISIAALND